MVHCKLLVRWTWVISWGFYKTNQNKHSHVSLWTQTPTCSGGAITWDASLFPVLWEVWTFSYPCRRRFKLLKSVQPLIGKYTSWDIWCSKTVSRSSVPRDVATPPSWSQHCSSKAGVPFPALAGLWHMENAVCLLTLILILFACCPVAESQNTFLILAWRQWCEERDCCPYMYCFSSLSLPAAWICSPPQSPD